MSEEICDIDTCPNYAIVIINDKYYFCKGHYKDLFSPNIEGKDKLIWKCERC